MKNFREISSRIKKGSIDPLIIECVRNAGEFRVLITSEIIRHLGLYEGYVQQNHKSRKICDNIIVAVPLNDRAESWFSFYRYFQDNEINNFSENDREHLTQIVRPIKWFHRNLMLSHGLMIAEKPITSAERLVLNLLMTDKSETEIADQLALTQNTVHTYITRICRKFNVRGRVGLISLWLGGNQK